MTFRRLIVALAPWLALSPWLSACGTHHWQADDHTAITAGPLLDQGRLYVTGSSYGIVRTLRSYDARTGAEDWRVELGGWEDCPALAVRDGALVIGCGSMLAGFDANTGHLNWRRDLAGPLELPVTLQDRLVVSTAHVPSGELELSVLSSERGEEIVKQILPAGSLVARQGGLVATAVGQTLSGIEANSGNVRWSAKLATPPTELLGSAAGLLVVTPQAILGFDPQTGLQKWSRPTDGQVTPATVGALLCYAQGGSLMGIDAETGQLKWERRMAGVVDTPALTPDVVYVHTAGGTLRALSSVDGEPLWELAAGPPGRLAVWNEEFYVWVTAHDLRIVNLVHRKLNKPIPLKLEPDFVDPDPTGWPIRSPLSLDGPLLYGVERTHRLFMYDLES